MPSAAGRAACPVPVRPPVPGRDQVRSSAVTALLSYGVTMLDDRRYVRSAAEAVTTAVKECRLAVSVGDSQARSIANAANSYWDQIIDRRRAVPRQEWAVEDFREDLRQRMRHDLLDLVTRQGFVPVILPHETVRYVTGGILDPENVHEVPESADWQMAVVILEVYVRTPAVDREAAVKAGILGG